MRIRLAHLALSREEPQVMGFTPVLASQEAQPLQAPWQPGCWSHHSSRGYHSGCTARPLFPQTLRLPVIFLPEGFQKTRQEEEGRGNPYEFLENKRRHTKRSSEGGRG